MFRYGRSPVEVPIRCCIQAVKYLQPKLNPNVHFKIYNCTYNKYITDFTETKITITGSKIKLKLDNFIQDVALSNCKLFGEWAL